ncbi:DUF7344 domain-containing protein [Natrialbaceae archaeon A-gly3]
MREDIREDIESGMLFHILGNDRRRYIIHILKKEGEIEVSDLAKRIAAIESGLPTEDVPQNSYKSVFVSLWQTHLPQMEKDGYIEVDDDNATVEPTEKLLGLKLTVNVEKGLRKKILLITQIGVVGITSAMILGTLFPDLVGFSVNTTTLIFTMPLLTIILALVFYIQRISGPGIEAVTIEEGDQ